ncbi:GlxA family transcriptional regulator [Serratia fonticola]|uniref:GlxA family transcriptional regulator n=1 Tax=Serratia fonticola TaxID=47917 RepID=UPI0024DE682C|nr:GlxA family transcriptional regulator [Serratia fonticola]MDK2375052.1 GlxA family transcriptional regulator [Serratia fonticola]
MKRIYFLLFNDFNLLDFSGSLQVFESANKMMGHEFYNVTIISNSQDPVTSHFGISLSATYLPEVSGEIDTLIVVGGIGVHETCKDNILMAWFNIHRHRFGRIVSICSGTFLLAEWGILNERRAVTHWASCDRLRKKHPRIHVDEDRIFINEGNIWSSAGVTAGIDLTLALVEEDIDHETSLKVAKDLVVYLRREGGQNQFSDTLKAQQGDTRISKVIHWIKENIAKDIKISELASVVNMSERNLVRLFHSSTGEPPIKFILKTRLDLAKSMLDNSDKTITKIALECGFKNEVNFRRSFVKIYKVSPRKYRKNFGRSES